MPNVNLYKMDGTVAGEITLAEDIFGIEVNTVAIHQVVVAQLAAKRQGTQCALTRSEVRGGGIKPWRQKGTGRARQGSIRAPQWTKGGVVFAPKPRSYEQKVNRKIKRIALFSALSSKVAEGDFIVVENLELAEAKTKEMVSVLKNLSAEKALVVTDKVCESVKRASANIPGVATTSTESLNVYDIMNHGKLVITLDAVRTLEEVYA